jgi:hypothetical protein
MIEFLALVRGPAPGAGAVAECFADEQAQQLAFEILRPRLIRRLVDDRLPSWALLNLEADKTVLAAARAAARLQSRLGALRELERRRGTLSRTEVPALATVIEARRACTGPCETSSAGSARSMYSRRSNSPGAGSAAPVSSGTTDQASSPPSPYPASSTSGSRSQESIWRSWS